LTSLSSFGETQDCCGSFVNAVTLS